MDTMRNISTIKRGFWSGIMLALLVVGGVLLSVHYTSAQAAAPDNPPPLVSDEPLTDVTDANVSPEPLTSTPVNSGNIENTATTTNSGNVGSYAALGDSVAAGLGLPLVPNATATDTTCGRSSQGYPNIVAASLNKPLANYACSGATAGDLFTQQGVSGPNIAPQLSQAYANNAMPDLITITAGANDVQWSNFIQKCYVSTCGTATDTVIANGALAVLQAKLYYMFYEIQSRSGSTPPTVVVTGYYNPLSAQCVPKIPNVTANEITWVTSYVASLNQTLQSVTSHFPFARFAPVDFTGHDLCSADSWVQGQSDPAPVHPTSAGQNAIAQSVLSALTSPGK
jgi:lysophospholipase L1-like esterase